MLAHDIDVLHSVDAHDLCEDVMKVTITLSFTPASEWVTTPLTSRISRPIFPCAFHHQLVAQSAMASEPFGPVPGLQLHWWNFR